MVNGYQELVAKLLSMNWNHETSDLVLGRNLPTARRSRRRRSFEGAGPNLCSMYRQRIAYTSGPKSGRNSFVRQAKSIGPSWARCWIPALASFF